MPTTTPPEVRQELFAAQDWCADLAERVRPDQLAEPTPCTELDVRLLLAHISVVFDKITAFATEHRDPHYHGELSPEQLSLERERLAREVVDGRTGEQLARSLRDKTEAARAAWTDEVLDTPIQLGWGPLLPGRVVAAIYLMETLAHSWDLAVATGQPAEAPGDLGHAGLAAARATLPEERAAFPFEPPVTPATDAGPTEQMANWTGRRSR
jgi:uncharacterized protein (TIGR03086 family)